MFTRNDDEGEDSDSDGNNDDSATPLNLGFFNV